MDKLNLMNSLITVVEQGSFTAAAAKLGRTKALISSHISQLEEDLKVRLFTRSTRMINLTTAGSSYYDEAKRIVDDIASVEAKLRKDKNRIVGRIRISLPRTYGELVLMDFIASFANKHQGITIDTFLTDRYVDLVSERFDVAIRVGNLDDSTLIARKVGMMNLKVCASPAFIEKHGAPTEPSDLSFLPSVMDYSVRSNSTTWKFKEDGKELYIKPSGILQVNSALAAAKVAAAGHAICYLPDFAVNPSIKRGELIAIDFDKYIPESVPINFVYSHKKHLSSKIDAFRQELESFIANVN